jgi:hypothetical protein
MAATEKRVGIQGRLFFRHESFAMPTLPSGLNLALSSDALIDNGTNWFHCPVGHFWYWDIDPELGHPPFDLNSPVFAVPAHAPAPENRTDVRKFIRVLEMSKDGKYGWRGDWLASFPQYIALDEQDAKAWESWLEKPETLQFLDETVEKCRHLAEVAQQAAGHFIARDTP